MSYWRLFYHFTWSTKNRNLWIHPEWEADLHRVIVAKAKELGAIVYAVGGIEDHVHLVASVPPKLALSDFAGQVKGNSSHFVNHVIKPAEQFNWQNSYGVVSFGEKRLDQVVDYVRHQKEHHHTGTAIQFFERNEDDEGSGPKGHGQVDEAPCGG